MPSAGVSLALISALSGARWSSDPLAAPVNEATAGIPDKADIPGMFAEMASELDTVDCSAVATVA